MNAAMANYEDQTIHYQLSFSSHSDNNATKRDNRPAYSRRRGKHPDSTNGIHRRRHRRIRW